MESWSSPNVPTLPGQGPDVLLHDTSTGRLQPAATADTFAMYVCGITPYDATHLGHAATFVTFDVLGRAVRDSGREVRYVQNVTDVDDPLFERAARDGMDWRELGGTETDLLREDLAALRVIPPQAYVGVMESIDAIGTQVVALLESGAAYSLPADDAVGQDVYLDIAAQPTFGQVSGWAREQMHEVFADRGGDPERAGKRDALDPLLWRAERPGEPSWQVPGLDAGRPGWHIECTTIAHEHLGVPMDVQAGGTDLIFPHHEMSAAQSLALTGGDTFAGSYAHQAMVGYQGEKMSKSKGNLVLVSKLRAAGVDPMAIRLTLLGHHYRTPWEYLDGDAEASLERLQQWRDAVAGAAGAPADGVLSGVRAALADDLNTPKAVAIIDDWVRSSANPTEATDLAAPALVADVADALLGLDLRS